jgi:hypothetical protein
VGEQGGTAGRRVSVEGKRDAFNHWSVRVSKKVKGH